MDNIRLLFVLGLFIVIYGVLHYYFYRKLVAVLPGHKKVLAITLGLFAGSVLVVEVMIHNDTAPFITTIAWLSFSWMGLVVLFFGLSLPLDIIAGLPGVLLSGLTRLGKTTGLLSELIRQSEKKLKSPTRTVIVALAVFVLGINGTFNAQQINVKRIKLTSEKIVQPLRIAQITDVHLGGLTRENHITDIVETINDLNADIIVSTGDLVDMSSDHSEKFIAKLAALQARLGKYAVYGNHETFAGIEKSRRLTEQAGFTLLSNDGVTLNGLINLFGVDDPSVAGRMRPGASHPDEPVPTFANGLYTVLLKHQPVITPSTTAAFDLQLSGHVHGGQIYPFGLLTRLYYGIPMGLSNIKDETWLYVSHGTGTWGPPMRVLAPPEITLFELQPAIMQQ